MSKYNEDHGWGCSCDHCNAAWRGLPEPEPCPHRWIGTSYTPMEPDGKRVRHWCGACRMPFKRDPATNKLVPAPEPEPPQE
jgi:hypothetical protein